MQVRPKNRLLEALSPECAERLRAASVYCELPLTTTLYRREQRPRHLYFLTAGIGSVVFISERGTSIELSTQGAEGLIGWASLLGPLLKNTECEMQVAGAGYRISLEAMQREFDGCAEIRRRVLEYAQHQGIAAFQVAACNRLHRAEARFVRWLLMVSDRLASDELNMTQEFMATMLGARRTTVAEVLGDLTRMGAIESRRGGLRIVDRRLLETRVCECYGILRSRYEALYRESRGGAVAPLPGL